ncbi:hypothetical protein OBBRIDRAFT_350188 [Obba rivulosa]|uniref:Uncharacterized protein n=1 Tax=Obba rivulosa TaxID=1052685 RepID=A0A8E2B5M7_9APHY|nr:hypothetical protein OBBRIDRAFT_350188 [Obba rivulosa]
MPSGTECHFLRSVVRIRPHTSYFSPGGCIDARCIPDCDASVQIHRTCRCIRQICRAVCGHTPQVQMYSCGCIHMCDASARIHGTVCGYIPHLSGFGRLISHDRRIRHG